MKRIIPLCFLIYILIVTSIAFENDTWSQARRRESPGFGWSFMKEMETPNGYLEVWRNIGERQLIMICLNNIVIKMYNFEKNERVDIDSILLFHYLQLSKKK
jgi:hypothetical protein